MGYGRLTYNGINLDFSKGFNEFRINPAQRKFSTYTEGGIREDYNLYNLEQMEATLNNLSAQDMAALDRFYEYARDGSTFSFERDRDLGTYIGFEDSLKTNDGTSGTFTRTHVANADGYVNPNSDEDLSERYFSVAELAAPTPHLKGILSYAGAADTPRYPAGKYGKGVLIEGSRDNELTYSEDFSHADWTKNNVTVSANTSETNAPDGESTADKLTGTGATSTIAQSTAVVSASGVDGVWSVWMKTTSSTVTVTLGISATGAATETDWNDDFTVTPYWQRFQIAFENGVDATPNTANTYNVYATFGNTEVVYAWGAQFESGANILSASNYIKTTSAAVTRNGELLTFPTSNVINNYKGTVAFWVKPWWVWDEHNTAILFQINSTVGSGYFLRYAIDSSGQHEIKLYTSANAAITKTSTASGDYTQFSWTHVCITYDTTIATNTFLYINGALTDTASYAAFAPALVDTAFTIGGPAVSSNTFCSFDDVLITKDVKDASWVNRLYNLGRGIGERKNRWSSVRLSDPNNNPVWRVGNRYNATLLFEEVKT